MSLPRQMGYRREKESRNRMDASQYQQYLEAKVVQGMEIYCEGTSKEWVEEFSNQAALYGKKNNNIAIEYVESWSAEESMQVGFEKLYEIGVENVKKAFPGHAFVVVPHVNKNGNFHTHVLFCPVSETGERMYSNFKERTIWNRITDENSIKNGLSTVRKMYVVRTFETKQAHV